MGHPRANGYTLIELMIVVVVIGIITAIAVTRFSNTRDKAFDAAAKGDLRNAMTAQEGYYADHNLYASDVVDLEFEQSPNVTTSVTSGGVSGYEMTASHSSTGAKDFCINSAVGEIVEGTTC